MSGGNFTQKYGIVATEQLFWAVGKHPLLIKAVFPKEKALKDLSFDVREDFEKLVKKIRVELRKPEITSEECYKAVKTLKASYNTKKCSQVWIGKFPFLEKTKSSPSSDAEKTEAPASEGEPKEFLPKSEEQKSTEARKMVITQEHPRTSEFSAITPEMVRYAEEKLVEWQLRHPCTSKGSRAPQDEAMTVLESMTSRDLKLKKEVAKAEMRALKPERKRTTGVDEIAFVKNRNLTDPVRFLKLEGLDEASERSQVKRVKLPQGIPKNPRPSRWDQKQPVPKEPKDPLLLINQESDRQKDVKKLLEQEVELFTPPTTPGHYDVNAPDFSDPFTLYGDSISQDFSDSSAGSWLDNVPFEFCAPVEKSTKPLKEVKTCSVMPKTEGPEVRPKTPTNELLYHPETHDPKDIYGTPTKEVLSEIWKVYTEYNAKNIIRR